MNDKNLEILAGLRASLESLESQVNDIKKALESLAESLSAAQEPAMVEAAGDSAQAERSSSPTESPFGKGSSERQPSLEAAASVGSGESPELAGEFPLREELAQEPAFADAPAAATASPAAAPGSAPAIIDVMSDRFAWKTDIPGSPVRNILSAISLNDRLLFINTLFGEDAAEFQKTISLFNSLSSLAEAETYVRSHFPKWDMKSEVVYRFMMAVRRKLL